MFMHSINPVYNPLSNSACPRVTSLLSAWAMNVCVRPCAPLPLCSEVSCFSAVRAEFLSSLLIQMARIFSRIPACHLPVSNLPLHASLECLLTKPPGRSELPLMWNTQYQCQAKRLFSFSEYSWWLMEYSWGLIVVFHLFEIDMFCSSVNVFTKIKVCYFWKINKLLDFT